MVLRIATVIGARPQFIKAAALAREIRAAKGVEEILIHTGQHFDHSMSDVFFEELEIPAPNYHLGIKGGMHGEMTGRMLAETEAVLLKELPDCVLVYGDTNSTLAGALAAAKLHIPVVHVEAGLRSFNRRMPEEVNRVLTDHVSTLLLCPTKLSVENLRREGIVKGVQHIGDVMYDAALFARRSERGADLLDRLGLAGRPYTVATVHRAESTDNPDLLAEVLAYVKDRAHEHAVVFPVHPRTRKQIEAFGLDLDGLLICEPLGYIEMHRLLRSAAGVLTDSGGLQKEAYFHRVPCVTLRSETEWVETIEAGWNRLWRGPDYAPRREIDSYGDGTASRRALDLIINRFAGPVA